METTYPPMTKGSIYLAAVVDRHMRRLLSWRLSVTMNTHFCLEAVEDAFEKYSKPEIMNTDLGSQYTLAAFADMIKYNGIKISMDGKGYLARQCFCRKTLTIC
jgi:putative transposase